VGDKTVLVVGTYGLDEGGAWTGKQTANAAQAIALVRPTAPSATSHTAEIKPALLEGLPRTAQGWAEGDLEVGGTARSGMWLERTIRTPAATNKGALFEVAHDGYSWDGSAWRTSAGRDAMTRGPHTTLPAAAILCPGDDALSLLASERASDGTTFIAGRCEDSLHRPNGPLLLGRYDPTIHQWQRVDIPPSVLFEGPEAIVNAGIVVVGPREAFVYAYRPFSEDERARPYLVHVASTPSSRAPRITASPVKVPFERSIVSLAHNPNDHSLWAVVGFASLHQMTKDGQWREPTPLPPLRFVDPIPSNVRLLDVHVANEDVWIHGAVPIVKEGGAAGREHVLYTTAAWGEPLRCDREQAPNVALAPASAAKKVKLAVVSKRTRGDAE